MRGCWPTAVSRTMENRVECGENRLDVPQTQIFHASSSDVLAVRIASRFFRSLSRDHFPPAHPARPHPLGCQPLSWGGSVFRPWDRQRLGRSPPVGTGCLAPAVGNSRQLSGLRAGR
ncbi:hypothetical protein EMIT048CA2_280021 [Pseudomonas chlororaphis]